MVVSLDEIFLKKYITQYYVYYILFQYVFCCSNQTHRYFCCQDPDKYYLHVREGAPEPSLAHLLILQL